MPMFYTTVMTKKNIQILIHIRNKKITALNKFEEKKTLSHMYIVLVGLKTLTCHLFGQIVRKNQFTILLVNFSNLFGKIAWKNQFILLVNFSK